MRRSKGGEWYVAYVVVQFLKVLERPVNSPAYNSRPSLDDKYLKNNTNNN